MHNSSGSDDAVRWAEIVASLSRRVPILAQKFVERIAARGIYSDKPVSPEDLHRTAVEFFRLLCGSMIDGSMSEELLQAGAELGARRARAGVPPEALVDAVRQDFSIIWSDLLEITETEDSRLLNARVETVWFVVERYASTTNTSYLAERVRMAREEGGVRQDFINALFGPSGQSSDMVAQTATALGVQYDGTYCVAAALGDSARELRRLAASLRGRQMFMHQAGEETIVFWQCSRSTRADATSSPVPAAVRKMACGLVENVDGLGAVARAGTTAAQLANVLAPGEDFALNVRTGWPRLARLRLAESGVDFQDMLAVGLRAARDAERDRVKETVMAFLTTGSISVTAARLYCHRNTILNRLRRFEELTGIDVTIPVQAARVVVAWG